MLGGSLITPTFPRGHGSVFACPQTVHKQDRWRLGKTRSVTIIGVELQKYRAAACSLHASLVAIFATPPPTPSVPPHPFLSLSLSGPTTQFLFTERWGTHRRGRRAWLLTANVFRRIHKYCWLRVYSCYSPPPLTPARHKHRVMLLMFVCIVCDSSARSTEQRLENANFFFYY